MSAISIEASGLRKRFGATQALQDISTRFELGTLHGLIGPDHPDYRAICKGLRR